MHRRHSQVLKVAASRDQLCSQLGDITFLPSSLGNTRGRIMAAAPCLMNCGFTTYESRKGMSQSDGASAEVSKSSEVKCIPDFRDV